MEHALHPAKVGTGSSNVEEQSQGKEGGKVRGTVA
jgi:hypothetical protein